MKAKFLISCAVSAMMAGWVGSAAAADASATAASDTVEEVVVLGRGETRQVQTIRAVEILEAVPGVSPLKVLNKLPSVNFQSADPFGNYEWSTRITIRGFNQNQLGFTLDGIVVVADAETVRRRAADRVVGRTVQRQLRAAELLVLNKLDLVSAESAAALKAWARTMAPDAVLIDAVEAQVPVSLLLGVHADTAHDHVGLRHDHDDDHDDEPHTEHDTWSWVFDAPVDRATLEAWVAGFHDGIVRAKGTVWLADDPGRRSVLQVVGRRSRLTPGAAWGEAERQTRLVAIGLPSTPAPASPVGEP